MKFRRKREVFVLAQEKQSLALTRGARVRQRVLVRDDTILQMIRSFYPLKLNLTLRRRSSDQGGRPGDCRRIQTAISKPMQGQDHAQKMIFMP
jgi:hypothetical protein